MKRLKSLLLIAFSNLIILTASAQWTGTTTPATYHLYAIDAVTNNLILAGGYGGSLEKSTDGGNTWTPISIGTTAWIQGIHFTDENHGWIICAPQELNNGYIMKTSDGGASWTQVKHDNNYSSMFWVSPSVCYVGTWEGVIVKTTDGGATWTTLNLPSTTNIPYLFFVDAQHGYAADTDSKLYRTTDGGATWQVFSHNGIRAFYFFDMNHGICVDEFGRVGTTTDGGATFSYWTSPYDGYKLNDICFANPQSQDGYIVGGLDCSSGDCINTPIILRTTDGGATWVADTDHPYVGQHIGFYDIDIAPNGTPYIAASNRIVMKEEAVSGLAEKEKAKIALYPNPVSNVLHIETASSLSGKKLYITDISGRIISQKRIDNTSLTLSVENLSSGMYFVKDGAGGVYEFVKE